MRSLVFGCGVVWMQATACSVGEPEPAALVPSELPAPNDASTARPASPDAAPAAPDGAVEAGPTRVPIFLAQGKLGRTTISCDDGRTWIADRSELPDARCWDDTSPNNIECDHHAWSSVGLVEAEGSFLATYGWGYAGVVRRTRDGVRWDDVLPGHTFAGLAYGNGRVVANERTPMVSVEGGAVNSWSAAGDVGSSVGNVRRIAFVPAVAGRRGRFLISLESGDARDIVWTEDDAATWHASATRPAECSHQVTGIVSDAGITVMTQSDGSVCRSIDGGETWTYAKPAESFSSPALVSDGAFYVWSGSTRWRSIDAMDWIASAGTPGVDIAAVARGASGTFVAVRGGWQVWYERQQFYRSTDGIEWEVLAPGSFVPGHPITQIIAGFAAPSLECPLR